MRKDILKLLAELRKVALTESERVLLHDRLERYIAMRPVRSDGINRLPIREEAMGSNDDFSSFDPVPRPRRGNRCWEHGDPAIGGLASSYFTPNYLISLFKDKRMVTLTLALILALGGSGTVAAAEGALPGDTLYPVKVSIVEPLRGLANVSTEAEAEWEIRLAERRLDEAITLAARGRLDAETRASLENSITNHEQSAGTYIASLDASGEAQAAADLQFDLDSTLAARHNVLSTISLALETGEPTMARTVDAGASAKGFGEAKQTAQEESHTLITLTATAPASVDLGADAEVGARAMTATDSKVQSTTTLEKATEMGVKAKTKLEAATKLYNSHAVDLSARFKLEVEEHLVAARDALAAGNAKLKAGVFAEAITKFQDSIRESETAEVLIDAALDVAADLGIDLDFGVDAPVRVEVKTGTETTNPTPATNTAPKSEPAKYPATTTSSGTMNTSLTGKVSGGGVSGNTGSPTNASASVNTSTNTSVESSTRHC